MAVQKIVVLFLGEMHIFTIVMNGLYINYVTHGGGVCRAPLQQQKLQVCWLFYKKSVRNIQQ